MTTYRVVILYRGPAGELLAHEHREEAETVMAFRTVMSRAWTGLCGEVEEWTEDVHELIERIEITRTPG